MTSYLYILAWIILSTIVVIWAALVVIIWVIAFIEVRRSIREEEDEWE